MILNDLQLFPDHKISFQRSRLLGVALGRVPGCVGVVASWDLLWTVHFRCQKTCTLRSYYFGFSLIFWLPKFLKCCEVILAVVFQRGGCDLKVFHLKLCITASSCNKTVCCHCSLLISDVDSWHKFQKSMSPPLCPVPHRGEGVNKAGCMNCTMLAAVTDVNTDILTDIW